MKSPPGAKTRPAKSGSEGLRFRIVAVVLCVSLLPMVLMGVGAWVVFGRLLKQKSQRLHRIEDIHRNLAWGTALFIFGGGISLGLAMGHSGAAACFADLFFPLVH